MRGGRECRSELFVEGKPQCLQGILSLGTQGHRAQSQAGGCKCAPHSDTDGGPQLKGQAGGAVQNLARRMQGGAGLPGTAHPFPSSHVPACLTLHEAAARPLSDSPAQ